jgi:hypothetical protein
MVSAAVYDESVRAFHRRFSAARRQLIVDLVREGIASGEFDLPGGGDVDAALVAEMLVGPLFYRRLMSGEEFSAQQVAELLDLLFGPV